MTGGRTWDRSTAVKQRSGRVTKRLYFGNLSWSVDDTELTNAVAQYGRVISARVVTDRETGRSRGFGFVEVEEDDAQTVIDSMNGLEWNGRPLTVNEAREREDRGFRPRR
jgi:RNA recognition motif-containing protein